MTLDRIKILLCAIVFLSVFSVGSYADENIVQMSVLKNLVEAH